MIAATTESQIVPIDSIQPSPENDEIYGAVDTGDNDLINLANDIADNGIREPIQISNDGYIISGHRRYTAAKLIELDSVPVSVVDCNRSDYSKHDWLKLLRAYNHQRVKSANVRLREVMLDVDPEIAHKQLIADRERRDVDAPPEIKITGEKIRSGFSDRLRPMLEAVIAIIASLAEYWPLSDRQIHYQLLNIPGLLRNASSGKQRAKYQNDAKSYDVLTNMLTRARLQGLIEWEALADETRPVFGARFTRDVAEFTDLAMYQFLRGYRRDLLQSQPDHIELICEKLTVQGIIEPIANRFTVPMTTGRGYCSIQPRHEIAKRFRQSGKDRLRLLIVSDLDPDGDEIAESMARSLRDDFEIENVVASKVLLRRDQVERFGIPPNLLAKESSSQFAKFVKRHKTNTVFELESIPPAVMQQAVQEAILSTIDTDAFDAELAIEKLEAVKIQSMRQYVADSFLSMVKNDEV